MFCCNACLELTIKVLYVCLNYVYYPKSNMGGVKLDIIFLNMVVLAIILMLCTQKVRKVTHFF